MSTVTAPSSTHIDHRSARRPVGTGSRRSRHRRAHLTTCCRDDIMSSMSTAHVAVYDTLADSEVGHLLVELRTGRFTGISFDIVTVAESLEPITTMGGLRVLPDALLADLDPDASDLLVLPGAELWDAGGGG